jgi:hypothetical protein
MVQDNFGPYAGRRGFDLAREYYASLDEESAAEIAARVGARYVVATPQRSGQERVERGSIAARLLPYPGGDGNLTLATSPADALSRHRLVFLSDDSDLLAMAAQRPWTAAVFEIVPGAEVVGWAPGQDRVRFELRLALVDRGALLYAASAEVDSAGRYHIRLPYATEGPMGSYVRAEESYRVASGGQTNRLDISDADVREGRTVEGPSFAP